MGNRFPHWSTGKVNNSTNEHSALSNPQTDSPSSQIFMVVPSAKKSVSWLTLVGLCIYTFAVATYYLPVGELGIVIATAGMALQITQVRIPRPFWYFAAFVAWSFVASFAAQFPEIARLEVVERTKLLAIFLIATTALRTTGQLRFFLCFFLACFILFPVRGALINFLNGC